MVGFLQTIGLAKSGINHLLLEPSRSFPITEQPILYHDQDGVELLASNNVDCYSD